MFWQRLRDLPRSPPWATILPVGVKPAERQTPPPDVEASLHVTMGCMSSLKFIRIRGSPETSGAPPGTLLEEACTVLPAH